MLLLAVLVRVVFAVEILQRNTGLEDNDYLDMWLYYQGSSHLLEGDLSLERNLDDYDRWIDWVGRDRFHHLYGEKPLINGPLYYYWVAGCRLIYDSAYTVRLVQVALTLGIALLTMSLAWLTTRKRTVSLVAFGLVAFQPTIILYSAFLLRATLITALLLAFCVGLAGYIRRPRGRVALGLGAGLGLVHLLKGIMPFLAPLVLLAILRHGGDRRQQAKHLGLAGAAFLLFLAPLMIRSQTCGTSLLHNGSTTHTNLVGRNHPGNDGLHLYRPDATYLGDVLDRSQGSTLKTLLETIATHPSKSSWVRLEGKKLAGFWGAYEPWNNVDYHTYRAYLSSLQLFPVTAMLLLPFALLGLIGGRVRPTWPAHAGWLIILAICLLAVPLSRNRLPALPFLAVFAALGLERAAWALKQRSRRSLLLLGVGLAAAVVLTQPWEIPHYPRHEACYKLAKRYEDPDQVARVALEAVEAHPWSGLDADRYHALEATPQERTEFIRLVDWACDACLVAGDLENARRLLEDLQRLYPNSTVVRERLRDLDDEAG